MSWGYIAEPGLHWISQWLVSYNPKSHRLNVDYLASSFIHKNNKIPDLKLSDVSWIQSPLGKFKWWYHDKINNKIAIGLIHVIFYQESEEISQSGFFFIILKKYIPSNL